MQTLTISVPQYSDKDGCTKLMPLEIPLTEECIYCNSVTIVNNVRKSLHCSDCGGKGYVYTKAGQDIIDFMRPMIEKIIDDKLYEHIEAEREMRDRC